ncbi:MAG TPA: hypothetical protein VIV10_10405, partial [Gemmatimonadales bacterium]
MTTVTRDVVSADGRENPRGPFFRGAGSKLQFVGDAVGQSFAATSIEAARPISVVVRGARDGHRVEGESH